MSDTKRAERIENKLDKISDQVNEINVTLAAQHISLTEHMRRTHLLEKAIVPVKEQLAIASGAIKVISLLLGGVGLTAAIVEILAYFK